MSPRTALARTLPASALLAAAALVSCQTLRAPGLPTDVHTTMVERVDPAAVIIWSLGSRTMSEASGSQRSRMDEAAWNELATAARTLSKSAGRLAEADPIRVGAHNEALEGFVSGPEIQARIDANSAAFRELARDAAGHASRLAQAADARDVLRSQALTKTLYDNCRACHSRYWEAHSPLQQ